MSWEVFKVNGKVFTLLTEVPGQSAVIVKAAPVDIEALQATHADMGFRDYPSED